MTLYQVTLQLDFTDEEAPAIAETSEITRWHVERSFRDHLEIRRIYGSPEERPETPEVARVPKKRLLRSADDQAWIWIVPFEQRPAGKGEEWRNLLEANADRLP